MSIDPRLMERRKTVAEDNAKKSIGRLLKFLLLVVAAGSLVWLVFSPWLSVSRVTTTGVAESRAHSILADHRVVAGTPMILVSSPAVEDALLEDPWVAEAELRLLWPDEVTVEIVERAPVAWARSGEGWIRRAIDGVALPSEPEPDEQMARIDLPGIGDDEAVDSVDMLGALEFVATLEKRLHPGTVVFYHEGEIWATVSGYQVRLGRAVAMGEKALSLGALLREGIPEGSTLVLIAPTNPAVMTPAPTDEAPEAGSEESAEGAGTGDEPGETDADV